MSAEVTELFPQPTVSEYQEIVTALYETEPDIFMILTAHRVDEGKGYEISRVFHADSRVDFINVLEKIITDIQEEIDEEGSK